MLPLTQTLPKEPIQTSTALEYDFLVIGYGDELCGDNAVGPWVATAVAAWQLPTVKSVAMHQLTPELTSELIKTNYVMFVDACSCNGIQTVQINPLVTHDDQLSSMAFAAHRYDPLALLNLTQRIYKRHPQAWWLQVPVESCDLGDQLSAKARYGCDRALRSIEQFLTTYRQPYLCMKSA